MLTNQELGQVAIKDLPRIGEGRARLFHKLGIDTLFDLLYYLPRRHEDRRIMRLKELKDGDTGTISGRVIGCEQIPVRKGLSVLRVKVRTADGPITAVWFNQPFLRKAIYSGQKLTVTGKVERHLFEPEISVSDYELGGDREMLHVGRLVPVYSTTEELSQRTLRRLIYQTVKNYAPRMVDLLPAEVRRAYSLMGLADALYQVHFPDDLPRWENARHRLAFDELFFYQLGLRRYRRQLVRSGINRIPQTDLPERFLATLGFGLTPGQREAIRQISDDLASNRRMYRLLQGDVGCGKTVVALYALCYGVSSGCQGALLAPTEVLAEQHHLSIKKISGQLGLRVALFTGAVPRKEREKQLLALQRGEIDIAVGTHALLEKQVQFQNLGVIVIDEQHRFGVEQRDLLLAKGEAVDLLVMTATPIPRSLTLTSYGELDLSLITDLPGGRKKVKTYFLPVKERARVYRFVKSELEKGRQAFVVCPLIEESEKLDLEAATQLYEELRQYFTGFNLGLLHGKLGIEEKEAIMEQLRHNRIQLLVATTVIEVGIDIPNATIMVIEGAERFGLSQLHQLRGRIGRGTRQSYCVLIGNPRSPEAIERIKTFVKCDSGFQIAEKDLALRGPGALMGTRQHGVSDFKVVNIFQDAALLAEVRRVAADWPGKVTDELTDEINFRFPQLAYSLKF